MLSVFICLLLYCCPAKTCIVVICHPARNSSQCCSLALGLLVVIIFLLAFKRCLAVHVVVVVTTYSVHTRLHKPQNLRCCPAVLMSVCAQDRGYVIKSGRTLVPTPLGRLLTAYLTLHFTEYVDVNFTAKVEEQLDEVSGEEK